MRILFVALCAWAALVHPAVAQEKPKLIGQFKNWDAFTYREAGKNVCYVASEPVEWNSQPKGVSRGSIHAIVTSRPATNVRDEVAVYVGYKLKDGSEAIVEIDGQKFTLFTKDEGAWAIDAKTDKAVAEAMARGGSMVVKGTSARGTLTTDRYSLAGFGAARDAANKACGVK
ncbi:MAG: hypothetical protein EXQ85_00670 [Alphaproteobacteria bacterium]|nr:hypothetical protein [Alphaproteobacteria bacterium]